VEALARGDVDVDKDCPDQVSPKFQLTFLVLYLAFKDVWALHSRHYILYSLSYGFWHGVCTMLKKS
jgi:hypothetical protein